jgi:hypothetical protein
MYQQVREELDNIVAIRQRLVDLGVVRSEKPFLCEFAEWLVAELFKGRRAEKTNEQY